MARMVKDAWRSPMVAAGMDVMAKALEKILSSLEPLENKGPKKSMLGGLLLVQGGRPLLAGLPPSG